MSEMRRVTAICNGTVIDHIPAGQAPLMMRMLGVDSGRSNPISMVMNVPSNKQGRKDVMKIEDRELSQVELDRLAIVAPHASVSIIRNYGVAEKRQLILADEMVDIARCSFANCITKDPREPMPNRILVISSEPLEMRCAYCGRSQDLDSVIENLL